MSFGTTGNGFITCLFQRGDRACFYTDALNKAAGRSRFWLGAGANLSGLAGKWQISPRGRVPGSCLARFGALPEADDPGSLGVSLLSLGVD